MAKTDNARFIYRNNPLIEVTCQLRFPTILKILSRPPVRFQEEVRPQFPVFGMAKENRGFTFLSEDRNWQLMLQNEFLALTVRRYDRWEEFREHLGGRLTITLLDGIGQPFDAYEIDRTRMERAIEHLLSIKKTHHRDTEDTEQKKRDFTAETRRRGEEN